jgi:hypothetical protein
MSRNLNLTLSLAAGLLGGMVSRWIIPTPALAQAPVPAPKDVRAQRFTLVTEDGSVLGVFGSDQPLDAGNNPARRPSASANALPTSNFSIRAEKKSGVPEDPGFVHLA